MEPGAIEVELRNIKNRLDANHDAIGTLRERYAGHDTAINVLSTELRELRDDIGAINRRLDRDVATINSRLDQLGKNFYAAAWAMSGLMLSVVGLIVAILTA